MAISETGSCLFDLAQLTNQTTISGASIEALRNETGADLVSPFLANGDCGGVAYPLTNAAGSPNYGLSVTVLTAPNLFRMEVDAES